MQKYSVVSILHAPLGFFKTERAVKTEILGHQFIRIKVNLKQLFFPCALLGKVHQRPSQAAPLICRVNRNILNKQPIALCLHHQDPLYPLYFLLSIFKDVYMAPGDQRCIISKHRRWLFPNPLDILRISGIDTFSNRNLFTSLRETNNISLHSNDREAVDAGASFLNAYGYNHLFHLSDVLYSHIYYCGVSVGGGKSGSAKPQLRRACASVKR